jgi:hypothetical protein
MNDYDHRAKVKNRLLNNLLHQIDLWYTMFPDIAPYVIIKVVPDRRNPVEKKEKYETMAHQKKAARLVPSGKAVKRIKTTGIYVQPQRPKPMKPSILHTEYEEVRVDEDIMTPEKYQIGFDCEITDSVGLECVTVKVNNTSINYSEYKAFPTLKIPDELTYSRTTINTPLLKMKLLQDTEKTNNVISMISTDIKDKIELKANKPVCVSTETQTEDSPKIKREEIMIDKPIIVNRNDENVIKLLLNKPMPINDDRWKWHGCSFDPGFSDVNKFYHYESDID